MALGKAVAAGTVAAIVLPYALRGDEEVFGGWIRRGLVHFVVVGFHVSWSWPLFCVVTLFAWGFLAWANR